MEAPESKEVLDTTPSAPMATDEPSAPPSAPIDTFQSNECVICLENKVKGNYYFLFFWVQEAKDVISVFEGNLLLYISVQHHFSALWSRLLLLELRKWPH